MIACNFSVHLVMSSKDVLGCTIEYRSSSPEPPRGLVLVWNRSGNIINPVFPSAFSFTRHVPRDALSSKVRCTSFSSVSSRPAHSPGEITINDVDFFNLIGYNGQICGVTARCKVVLL